MNNVDIKFIVNNIKRANLEPMEITTKKKQDNLIQTGIEYTYFNNNGDEKFRNTSPKRFFETWRRYNYIINHSGIF